MKNSLFVPLLLIATALVSFKKPVRIDENKLASVAKHVVDSSRYVIFSVQRVPDERFNIKRSIKLLPEDLAVADNKLKEFVIAHNSKTADTIYIKRSKKYYIISKPTIELQRYSGFVNRAPFFN